MLSNSTSKKESSPRVKAAARAFSAAVTRGLTPSDHPVAEAAGIASEEDHPIGPVVHAGSRVLICGTFPPVKKPIKFYYPNANNDMWRVLGEVFRGDKDHFYTSTEVRTPGGRSARTVRSLNEETIREFATSQPVGFFDVCGRIRRHLGNSSDDNIETLARTDVFHDVLAHTPNCVAVITTGTLAMTMLLDALHDCGTFASATGERVEAVTHSRVGKVKYNLPRVGGKLLWTPGATAPFHDALWIYRAPSTSRALPVALSVKTAHYRAMFAAHLNIAEDAPGS